MANEIQVLKQTELLGQQFAVYGTPEEPLFLAKDVAAWIEYDLSSVNKLVALVDEDEKVRNIVPTLGGNQEMWLLTESGLYEVLMQSRKPIAKEFKKGVKKILHEIRTVGGYLVTKVDDTPEMIMARAVLVAQATIEKQSKQIAEQSAKIEADAPKVLFAEAVETSDSVCLVGELAKILKQNGIKNMGQNRLYRWLRSHCYLGNKGDNYNLPTQKAMDLGVFKVIKGKRIDKHTGGVVVTRTAKVTTKGLKYFINKFMNTAAVL